MAVSDSTGRAQFEVVGRELGGWQPPPPPPRIVLEGRYARVEPLDMEKHSRELFEANRLSDAIWNYLPYGPFQELEDYQAWMRATCLGEDPFFFAIVDKADGKAKGVASYLAIVPEHGSIEVGHLNFSPLLQRTRVSTEAMYLMMKNIFQLGYRRYEWKANALNERSRSLAQRLGFSYEGVFRNHKVARGRNRDTAWYACIDDEFPKLQEAFETYLAPENFDFEGVQLRSLSSLTQGVLVSQG